MNKYVIPEELKSETELVKGLTLTDIIIIGVWYTVTNPFKALVDERLTILYTLFNLLFAFLLTRRSLANQGKRIYEELIIYFTRDRNIYHMMALEDNNDGKEEDSKKSEQSRNQG